MRIKQDLPTYNASIYLRIEKEIRVLIKNCMFKLYINLDRHGLRPLLNICLLLDPQFFSFPTTFKCFPSGRSMGLNHVPKLQYLGLGCSSMKYVRMNAWKWGQRTGVSVSVNGFVEVRYDLGSGPTSLTSVGPIQLGEWHHLLVERYRQVSSQL